MKNNWIAPNPEFLPDFIIGGAMKSGTSTLHEMLARHPKVFIPRKEIHFFDMDNILQHPDFNFYDGDRWIFQSMEKQPKAVWEWYLKNFKGRSDFLKGEDSTTYLASKKAAERISLQKKEIKLIFLLRQPSLRAYSNYYHLLRTGKAAYNFEDMIRYMPFPILNRSLYKEQIENYYAFIPPSQIKIILFEDFIQNTKSTLREVGEFLNLNVEEFPSDTLETHANKAKLPKFKHLQIKKNRMMRNFGNQKYTQNLPQKAGSEKKAPPLAPKLINKFHKLINPKTSVDKPKIKPETKLFLDSYFYERLKGIDELTDKKIMKKWFD